ncbi:glycoprotein A33 (transmembrane), paralog a [Lepisosteus oculatus]|uniref:glycoprotein A33 (transmembrane), paralog a n=1 Tax=Lepisosteus oculatus TaxID=7918 RepID=UPI0035F5084D
MTGSTVTKRPIQVGGHKQGRGSLICDWTRQAFNLFEESPGRTAGFEKYCIRPRKGLQRRHVKHYCSILSIYKTTTTTTMLGGLIISAVLSAAWALEVTIPKDTYDAARGGNITIPCSFKSTVANLNNMVLSWLYLTNDPNGEDNQFLTYYAATNQLDLAEEYQGRAGLKSAPVSGDSSIYINRLTMSDNGTLECRLQIPGDNKGKKAAKVNLIVLVAPSKPICKLEGTPEYGQNIKATCYSEEGSPQPTYKWQIYDVQNRPKPNPPKSTEENGILSLVNVSIDTSGFYVCTSQNRISSAICNMTVSVMPPSMNIASTAGIIGGVAAALLLVGVLAYCCCCRKKEQAQEYAMGPPEEGEYHDQGEDKQSAHNGVASYRDDVSDDGGARRGPPMVPPNKPRRDEYED